MKLVSYYVMLIYFAVCIIRLYKIEILILRRGRMRLSDVIAKTITIVFLIMSTSLVYAYDYPVVGEYNSNYQRVFEGIKSGNCEGMQADLQNLEEQEGVSPDIYLAICFFEKSNNDQAFKVISRMLSNQDYDEILYLTQSMIEKGNSEPRLIKYRGLGYFNIGAYKKATTDLEAYLVQHEDEEVRYSLVDIYVTLKEYDKATLVLNKTSTKGGRYYFRSGRISLRTGKVVTALKNLRNVTASDTKVYPSAKMLIGEICASSKRFLCAEKEYNIAAQTEAYSDTAKDKISNLEDSKKLFSGFLSIGEQYDTNVTSIDEDELPGASEVSSARTYAVADLKLNFYPSFADTLSIGTMHYATWNANISSYDMSMHKVYFSMKHGYDAFEVMLPKITAAITYFDDERYSTSTSIEGYGKYKMDTWTFTLPVKMTRSNYENDEATPTISKDGNKYEASLEVMKKFMKVYTAKVIAGVARDDVKGSLKKKRDTIFKTSLSARWFPKFTPTLGFNYANYDYDNISRKDDYYSYSLKGVYVLTPNIFLGGGVTYTKTDSNENAYDYSKTVSEVSVSYSF